MSGGGWLDEESTAVIADQIFEKMESARQQLDFAAGTVRRARYEVADPEHRFLDHRLAAAGQGVDAAASSGFEATGKLSKFFRGAHWGSSPYL
jgi:hypothetical protein